MTITCIIPFFNERKRVLKVLDIVVKIKEIDQIICVDDGSTDGTADTVKKHYPNLLIIHNKINLGKTEAIKAALQRANGSHILLLDADLQNLQYKDGEKAITTVKNNPSIDMLILKRNNKRLFRAHTLLSGERILQKKELLEILTRHQPQHFQIELAINQFMMDTNKNVYWMPISAAKTSSIKKRGRMKGIYKIIHMHIEIVTYIGIHNVIRQILFFGKREYMG